MGRTFLLLMLLVWLGSDSLPNAHSPAGPLSPILLLRLIWPHFPAVALALSYSLRSGLLPLR